MPIVWNLFFSFCSAYSVNCYFILFSFILLMATAFLSIAGNDSLNVFSQKSYVREAIRWLRPITENWRCSWKFDRKANTTESNSHCFFKYFNCNQFQAIWAGRGRGCFWGTLGGTRRRVGDRDMGGGKGASVRFGGWPRSTCNVTKLTESEAINLHLFLEWFGWVMFINICVCIKYGSVDL